jgi:hypothetical protein
MRRTAAPHRPSTGDDARRPADTATLGYRLRSACWAASGPAQNCIKLHHALTTHKRRPTLRLMPSHPITWGGATSLSDVVGGRSFLGGTPPSHVSYRTKYAREAQCPSPVGVALGPSPGHILTQGVPNRLVSRPVTTAGSLQSPKAPELGTKCNRYHYLPPADRRRGPKPLLLNCFAPIAERYYRGQKKELTSAYISAIQMGFNFVYNKTFVGQRRLAQLT